MQTKTSNWNKNSLTIKIIVVGVITLLLLIPSSMIQKLIHERSDTKDQAVEEVTEKWGKNQTFGGALVSVPYKKTVKNSAGVAVYETHYAHFLPEDLSIETKLEPIERYRGIYKIILYKSVIKVKGYFKPLALEALTIPEANYLFDKAFIQIGISDLKGINEVVKLSLNKEGYEVQPGIPTNDVFPSGLHCPISWNSKDTNNFSFTINLNGSSTIEFIPLGKQTNVELTTTWKDPSFNGSFLPSNRKVDSNGTLAQWKILHINRNFPQQGIGYFISDYAKFSMGLIVPVNEYQKTLRSSKYDIMFIALTFIAYLLMEIIGKQKVHPIHYLLIGFSIVLFYILLLSFSEHISFDWAYTLGALSILAIVSMYTKAILKSTKNMLLLSSTLTLLYAFFYFILQLQDYALLMGSIGLFIILSVIMFLTRNIDFYESDKVDKGEEEGKVERSF